MNLFVYGTLLSGLERHGAMSGARCLGPALASGRLINLGSYAGLLEETTPVVGELYEVDDALMSRLDTLEGFNAADLRGSLYVHRECPAKLFADGSVVVAEAYYYNQRTGDTPAIEWGDYRRERAERNDRAGLKWIVAFGSNLDTARLDDRLKDQGVSRAAERNASAVKGCLNGFKLIFNKRSDDGTRANIRYVGNTSACPAVAWALNNAELTILDKCEAAPASSGSFHYRRIGLPFHGSHGMILAQAYLADPDHLCEPAPPPEYYLSHIRSGYAEHKLEESHLREAVAAARGGR